ncbi:MAG: hypothetical protein WCQ77_16550 [Planctomycetota bacterium]
MATGGALGGLFNALVAPVLFDAHHEFLLVVAVAAGMIPPVARSWSLRPRLLAAAAGMVPGLPPSRSLWLVAIGAAALVAVFAVDHRERAVSLALVWLAAFWMIEQEGHVLYRTRTFFGVLRVEASDNGPSRELVHGTIRHGVQLVSSDPDRRRIPLAYDHPTGPLGSIFAALEQSARPGRVGVGDDSDVPEDFARLASRWRSCRHQRYRHLILNWFQASVFELWVRVSHVGASFPTCTSPTR